MRMRTGKGDDHYRVRILYSVMIVTSRKVLITPRIKGKATSTYVLFLGPDRPDFQEIFFSFEVRGQV